jgi:hypothetical protein
MRYQGQLSVLEEDLDDGACYVRLETKSELERLKSVVEPLYANAVALEWVRKNYPEITIFEDASTDALPETLTLIAMPEAARLEIWIRAGVNLRFALTERTLGDLEHAERYPLEALRLYERHAKKGMAIPTRARELLDEVRGLEDVDVYRSSGTVLRDELETYRAVTFARFYRAADDAGFTRAVKTLYGGLTVERVATDADH